MIKPPSTFGFSRRRLFKESPTGCFAKSAAESKY
jgi:hypothetical protein